MGDLLKGVANALTGGVSGLILGDDDVDSPASAKKLEKKASEEAEKKRLARVQGKETTGKTMFSDPLVNAGMPLKKELGA